VTQPWLYVAAYCIDSFWGLMTDAIAFTGRVGIMNKPCCPLPPPTTQCPSHNAITFMNCSNLASEAILALYWP